MYKDPLMSRTNLRKDLFGVFCKGGVQHTNMRADGESYGVLSCELQVRRKARRIY